LGGRLERGGVVVDFILYDPPMGISVLDEYYHLYPLNDRMQRAEIESQGLPLIYVDQDDLERDPILIMREALSGRDHSKIARL